ncbi:MAG: SAM hydrolase/SAM-dependent halogenase family protein [Chloroflexota bacterium]
MSMVTLLTDFGLADGYAGILHGVIRSLCPGVEIVDLSHQVAPRDVPGAAYLLYTAYPFFPPDSVHAVIVDPGVGTARRAIAVTTAQGRFVAPDNGVLSYVLACEPLLAAISLTNPRYQLAQVSHTFHGRDLFAPAAAHLACGVPLHELGEPVDDPETFDLPGLQPLSRTALRGQVIYQDRFGNLISNFGRLVWQDDDLLFAPVIAGAGNGWAAPFSARKARVSVGGRHIRSIQKTYGAVACGELLALVGSAGHLEIAVAGGSAAATLGVGIGAEVILEREAVIP